MYPFITNVLLFNLLIVLISETTLAVIFGARSKKSILTVVLVNVLTNPPIVLTGISMAMFLSSLEPPLIYILEVFVFLLEGFIYLKCKTFGKRNPYLISLVLNLSSYALGELINILM